MGMYNNGYELGQEIEQLKKALDQMITLAEGCPNISAEEYGQIVNARKLCGHTCHGRPE